MTDSAKINDIPLPPEISAKLMAMIRRVRVIQLLRGLCATLATATMAVLAVMATDLALPLAPTPFRVAVSFVAMALVLAVAAVALVRPLADPIPPIRMARIVETRHPELEERVSSAIELLSMGGAEAEIGSRELMRLLASAALSDIASIAADHEFKGATLKPFAIAAAAAAAVLLLCFAISARKTALLFVRAVAPTANLGNAGAIDFAIAPGDITITEGTTVTFSLQTRRTQGERAEIVVRRDGESAFSERLTRDFDADQSAPPRFHLSIPAITKSFSYRMRMGDGLSRRFRVTVVPPPSLESLSVRLDFPAYIGAEPTQLVSNALFPLRAPHGTVASAIATFNRPMSPAIRIGASRILPLRESPANPADFEWTLSTNQATTWTIDFGDDYGFTNTTGELSYDVIPDYPPSIRMTYPTGSSFVLPTFGHLKTVFELRDDHAIAACKIVMAPDGDPYPWTIDLSPELVRRGVWEATREIALGDFILQGRKSIKIWLEAEDDLPPELGGPNRSRSRVIAVKLDNGEHRSLADQVRIPQRDELRKELDATAKKAEETVRKLEEAKRSPTESEFLVRLEDAIEAAEETKDKAETAAETAEDGLFAKVSDDISEAASPIEETVENLSELPLSDDAERARALDEAIEKMKQVAAEARETLSEINRIDKALETASALESLANEENAQAKKALERQMTSDELSQWRDRQNDIANRAEPQMEKLAEMAAEIQPQGTQEKSEKGDSTEVAHSPRDAAEAAEAAIAAQKAEEESRNASPPEDTGSSPTQQDAAQADSQQAQPQSQGQQDAAQADSQQKQQQPQGQHDAAQADSQQTQPQSQGQHDAAQADSQQTQPQSQGQQDTAQSNSQAKQADSQAKRPPSTEQRNAAQKAYSAAQELKRLSAEAAEIAGLDQERMKAGGDEDAEDGESREDDSNKREKKEKLPARTIAESGAGEHDSNDDVLYEDGLVLEMPEWLRRLGFPFSEWLKYRGSLESGLPDSALDKVPEEFRELVRQYFRLISTEK